MSSGGGEENVAVAAQMKGLYSYDERADETDQRRRGEGRMINVL